VALQKALTKLGYTPGTADGKFGSATTQAVIAFQKAKGLPEDGVAGAKTLAAVNAALANG
jgi:peptidoglycan hydrolase-like protein with peptidoglycan-binding domain